MDRLPKIEGEPYVHQAFPAWCKGPKGEEQVFDSEAEVPAGWTLPDGKTKGGKSAPAGTVSAPAPAETAPSETGSASESAEVDAAGVAFDPEKHAKTKTKTGAGLWRMKVGVKRPEGEDVIKAADGEPLDL